MKRTFKVYFDIFSEYDCIKDIYLGKVKAQGSTKQGKFLKWNELENYDPHLVIQDTLPKKLKRNLHIAIKIKNEIQRFNIGGKFDFNGTHISDIDASRVFKNGVHVKIKHIEHVHSGFYIPKIIGELKESHLHSITYQDIAHVSYLSKYFTRYNQKHIESGEPLLRVVSVVSSYDEYEKNLFIVFYQTVRENSYISI